MHQTNWMKTLADHYENMRARYPEGKLLIVFDIDGTILDRRTAIPHLLRAYDEKHGTHYFSQLQFFKVTHDENRTEWLLEELGIPEKARLDILDGYDKNRWSADPLSQGLRPFHGVLEIIRWFQLQGNTDVGLNTGRPESVRCETLNALNKLGKRYKVRFSDSLLQMNPHGWNEKVKESKAQGIQRFLDAGFHVFAFVDNEADNLTAVAEIDSEREIILLHADTLFESKRVQLPAYSASGNAYDLCALIDEKALPQHLQFVWNGINDEENLKQFLVSDVRWGACDLGRPSFSDTGETEKRHSLDLDCLLKCLSKTDKSILFELNEGGDLIDPLIESVDFYKINPARLWFHGSVGLLEEEFRTLSMSYPKAILQTPVDFIASLILSKPKQAKAILDLYKSWGINRFAINWCVENLRGVLDQMDRWGLECTIVNVRNLEEFLKATLLMPAAIAADFNFPQWHYYGRGSGKNGHYHEYLEMRTEASHT